MHGIKRISYTELSYWMIIIATHLNRDVLWNHHINKLYKLFCHTRFVGRKTERLNTLTVCALLDKLGIGKCVFWRHNGENHVWWLSSARITKHKYFETWHDFQNVYSHSFDFKFSCNNFSLSCWWNIYINFSLTLNWFWKHHFTDSMKMIRTTLDCIQKCKSINEYKRKRTRKSECASEIILLDIHFKDLLFSIEISLHIK